jgi:hypothetical protein
MARYYYSIEGTNLVDHQGSEHSSLMDAHAEAVLTLAELLPSKTAGLFRGGAVQVTVSDEGGLVLFTVEASGTIASPDASGRLVRSKELRGGSAARLRCL